MQCNGLKIVFYLQQRYIYNLVTKAKIKCSQWGINRREWGMTFPVSKKE